MDDTSPYFPPNVFAREGAVNGGPPRVFISPQRYIQGQNVLQEMGAYLSLVNAKHVAVLISARGERNEGVGLLKSLRDHGIAATVSGFGGECSLEEIERHVDALKSEALDGLLAVGGGKTIDAGKAIAYRLDVPVVIAPTIASNDAPCSALSVLYAPDGESQGVEFYPCSPALVVVDSQLVAAAPERFLVAGIGDAMATWYEADVCRRNTAAVNVLGGRSTLAAMAIGRICADTLFDCAEAAVASVADQRVDEALENVIEANTLLSGLGFESGGLAAAHGYAQAFTVLPAVEKNYLHGEMVAMGTLAQLALEDRPDELRRVAQLFASVGLPVHLEQLGIDRAATDSLALVSEAVVSFPFLANMPMALDAESVIAGLLKADELGRSVAAVAGDSSYRRLQAG